MNFFHQNLDFSPTLEFISPALLSINPIGILEFFSPISNKRKDIYGGSLENRCKLLVEIVKVIRKIWPKNKILGARVTGKDWLKSGSTVDDCIFLVNKLKKSGLDYVCVSSGGILSKTNIIFKPGYQIHLARKIKKKTGIITRATGMITE